MNVDLEQAVKDSTRLVDELTYASYKFNRERSPNIAPERWARIFPEAVALEKRFQRTASS
jgi:hypothetical protein